MRWRQRLRSEGQEGLPPLINQARAAAVWLPPVIGAWARSALRIVTWNAAKFNYSAAWVCRRRRT